MDYTAAKKPAIKLSKREYEVFLLIGLGSSYEQIAEKLCIKTGTVSTYRGRILKKMKLKTTNEIIRYAVVNNLIN